MNVDSVKRQSIISLFWQITFTLVGFLSTMYFAHAVGASTLGSYFLFLAYIGIFGMFTDGGFGGAAVKRISEGEEENEYFTAYFVIRLVFTLMVILALFLFKEYFVDLNESDMFFWLVVYIFLSIFVGPISTGVAGRDKIGVRTTCSGIGNISKVIFQIIFVYFGYEAAGLAGGAVGGLLASLVIEFHFLDLKISRFGIRHIKSLSIFSFWIFLTAGGALVFSQADTVMIGYFLDNSDVGIYRVAFQFTTVATFTSYALRTTLWPKISRWSKNGEYRLIEKSLSKAFNYSFLLALPVFFGGIILGDRLLYYFYGADFASGYMTLSILLLVQLVNVFQYFFTTYLDALGHPEKSFKATAISVVANILGNYLLIPIFGILGAAIATFITMSLNAFLGGYILNKIISIQFEHKSLINILKSSMVMGIVIIIYRTIIPIDGVVSALLPVLIGSILYFVLVLKLDPDICADILSIFEKAGFSFSWFRYFQ